MTGLIIIGIPLTCRRRSADWQGVRTVGAYLSEKGGVEHKHKTQGRWLRFPDYLLAFCVVSALYFKTGCLIRPHESASTWKLIDNLFNDALFTVSYLLLRTLRCFISLKYGRKVKGLSRIYHLRSSGQ
jgi:hypothetical protein